jgi:hypothetical protein
MTVKEKRVLLSEKIGKKENGKKMHHVIFATILH